MTSNDTDLIARPLGTYGVVANSYADQTGAINAAVARARADGVEILRGEAGAVYRHAGTITFDGVGFDGQGATLLSLVGAQSALTMSGHGGVLRQVRLAGAATGRGSELRHCGLVVTASDFRVEDVRIDGSAPGRGFAGAGAMFFGARRGVIRNLRVEDSHADGIHVTYGSEDLTFHGGGVFGSGDDGFAVVSYLGDGRLCKGISTEGMVIVEPRARGIAIVGGHRIRHDRIQISRSSAAAIYVCSEPEYDTYGVTDWQVKNFIASDCVTGIGLAKDFTQAIILIYGRAKAHGVGNAIVFAVTDGELAGRVTGMGQRAPSALDTNNNYIVRIRYDLMLERIRGANASGYATLLGGRDCSGSIDVRECDGIPFILSSKMTGNHNYARLSAMDTRLAAPKLEHNIHGDGARNFISLYVEAINMIDAPGMAFGGDIDTSRTAWGRFYFNGRNIPSPSQPSS